jgi:hypothetical protein
VYQRSHACHLSESWCITGGGVVRRGSISVCNRRPPGVSTQFPRDFEKSANRTTYPDSFKKRKKKSSKPCRTHTQWCPVCCKLSSWLYFFLNMVSTIHNHIYLLIMPLNTTDSVIQLSDKRTSASVRYSNIFLSWLTNSTEKSFSNVNSSLASQDMPALMKPKGLLPPSEVSASARYSEWDESRLHNWKPFILRSILLI